MLNTMGTHKFPLFEGLELKTQYFEEPSFLIIFIFLGSKGISDHFILQKVSGCMQTLTPSGQSGHA